MTPKVELARKSERSYLHDPSAYAFAALWLVVLTIPVEYAVRIPSLGTGTRVLGALAVLCGVAAVLVERRFRRLTWFHLGVCLFVGWAGLSYFWSFDPDASIQRLGTYFRLTVLLWLIWQFATTKERLHHLLKAYVYGGTLLAVVVIFNRLVGDATVVLGGEWNLPVRYSAFGTNVNHVGILLVFGAAISCYLAAREQSAFWVWFHRLHFGMAAWAILLTGSRGALLAAFCVIAFMPFAFWHLGGRRRAADIAIRCAVLCVVPFLIPRITAKRITRITKAEVTVGNPAKRVTIWAAALDVFRENPVLGVGIGAFPVAVEPYLGKRSSAHSGAFSVLAETGPLGLLLFGALIVMLIRQGAGLNRTELQFWLCLLAVWLVGCGLLPWDDKKVNWFTLAIAASWMAVSIPALGADVCRNDSDLLESRKMDD